MPCSLTRFENSSSGNFPFQVSDLALHLRMSCPATGVDERIEALRRGAIFNERGKHGLCMDGIQPELSCEFLLR